MKTTRAQIKANRNNAKKSTGPRTEEGKARVAQNALKHGLLARDTVLPGEDAADFDRQLSALEADLQPANSLEFELVRQIADSQWRMHRLTRLETGFLAAAVADQRRHLEKRRPEELRPGYDGETLLLGSAMLDRTQAFVRASSDSAPEASVPGDRAPTQQAPLTQTTKQTQFRRTSVESTRSNDEPRSVDLAFEIRGLCSAPPPTDNASPSVVHYRLPDAAGLGFTGFSANMTELHQVPTAHRPTTEPRAVSKLSVGGSANRSLTVAAPADGSRLLRSRAREQAVSPKIPLGFLKKEVFSQTRQPAAQHPGNTARVREGFSNSEGTACRPRPHQPQTTKQTQFRRTSVESSANRRSTNGRPAGSRRRPSPATKAFIVMAAAPNAPGNLPWRTLSACRVETLLDAWSRFNHK